MVFDPEETKSTGLVNRLIAEKDAPKCNVFWSNDPLRMEILKQRGILALYRSPEAREIPAQFKAPESYWTGFSGRIRVILVNKDLVKPKDYPHGIFDLLDARWKGTFALANPLGPHVRRRTLTLCHFGKRRDQELDQAHCESSIVSFNLT